MLLKIESVQVNIGGNLILRDISFSIQAGEQWAIFGPAGSGKTVLAHTICGQHSFQGRIIFQEQDNEAKGMSALVVDQQHRFRDLRNQNDLYYQQRYNSFDSETTRTVRQDLSVFPDGGSVEISKINLLRLFRLSALLDEPLIQLSNGENKRLQILKAILRQPTMLILDEPYTGLDIEGRFLLDEILSMLSQSGRHLIFLSSRDHVPSCFNRFALLENGCLTIKKIPEEICLKQSGAGKIKALALPSGFPYSFGDFDYAVRMRHVSVQYDNKSILDNISWEVEKGSRWALTGPNGAGKSTLLSLITADNPQAYANEIYLFDRRRGSGESIWEIKQKTGYLSPELHLYFDPAATAFTAIASGLFDTIGLFRKLAPHQQELVSEWLFFLGCAGYADRLLKSLPTGIQRLILLGRAFIKRPPLIILDEPCQGLDASQTAFTLELTDRYCRESGATLIFVSHYELDFPACINQHLRLEKGKRS